MDAHQNATYTGDDHMTDKNAAEIADFKGFLEEASPEDFERSSAIDVSPGYPGPGGFGQMIQRRLTTAKEEFEECEGEVNPLVFLANEHEEREFEAYHDETMLDFFMRINREAKDMRATMTFVAMNVPASRTKLDVDGMDGESVRDAIDRGELKMHYGWYAEHRASPTDEPDRRCGLWEVIYGGSELGERIDGNPTNAPLFHAILA